MISKEPALNASTGFENKLGMKPSQPIPWTTVIGETVTDRWWAIVLDEDGNYWGLDKDGEERELDEVDLRDLYPDYREYRNREDA